MNSKGLTGGRDRTRTCDLLRVKQGVRTIWLLFIKHLQRLHTKDIPKLALLHGFACELFSHEVKAVPHLFHVCVGV
jgi:hypothetical protein